MSKESSIVILSIETSCDETAVSIIEASGGKESPSFVVLGNTLASQAALHAEYGGVFPSLAKREHSKKIIPLLLDTLGQANLLVPTTNNEKIEIPYLEREEEAKELLLDFVSKYEIPKIDAVAVTVGPGLEPALWVGVSVAKALASIWQKPLVPVNHMEGHITSVLMKKLNECAPLEFPAIALLVSGGHTELHIVKNWSDYTLLGKTRDDAAGEAFDKVARMLDLPYPGGPKVSALAAEIRGHSESKISLPRPMLHSNDYDFSFSGIKTAVRYLVQDLGEALSEEIRKEIACEFENAVVEVLVKKTLRAVDEYGAQSIIVGGGVAANNYLREVLTKEAITALTTPRVVFPEKDLATDNSVMIGIAGYFEYLKNPKGTDIQSVVANGNLHI